jgi:acetyl/propionyl-CoA carboxylase alpha subunit
MNIRGGVLSLILAAGIVLMGLVPESLAERHHHYRVRHVRIHEGHHHKRHHQHSKVKKIASIGAPIAIGAAFGPAGSVGYQVVKHRKAIKHHLIHH